jgi:hypothetical protein
VISKLLDAFPFDEYKDTNNLFFALLEDKEIPQSIREVMDYFCSIIDVEELKNYLLKCG